MNPKMNLKMNPKMRTQWRMLFCQLIRMNKYVTREEMASQIEVSLSTVKRSINKLKTSGIIEYEGPSKGGYWIIK